MSRIKLNDNPPTEPFLPLSANADPLTMARHMKAMAYQHKQWMWASFMHDVALMIERLACESALKVKQPAPLRPGCCPLKAKAP
jgi:hypothetical protein